jgi:hypothetical protein
MLELRIVMDPLRLTANVKVATFLGSIPASSDTAEFLRGGRQSSVDKSTQKFPKNTPEVFRYLFLNG